MPERPNPEGWVGGSEDFGFLTTQDGHRSVDRFATGDDPAKFGRRNARKSLDDFFEGDA